jgi:hypothetical protein
MRLTEAKQWVTVAPPLEVTNHYITRPDHPCFGTRRRVVTKVTGSSFYLDGGRIGWPKASQVAEGPNGELLLYGHPKAGDLFLTLRRAPELNQ